MCVSHWKNGPVYEIQVSEMNEYSKSLESPFKWNENVRLAETYDEMQEPVVEFDEEPVLCLMTSAVNAYCQAVQRKYKETLKELEKVKKISIRFDSSQGEKRGVSIKVLRHIAEATEYEIYKLIGNKSETEKILKNITDSNDFLRDIEVATVHGCKSIMYSCFHEAGHEAAIKYAKLATSVYSECALWYYILGKNLRRARRTQDGKLEPSHEEKEALNKCRALSDEYFYSIYVAQMYREEKHFDKCKKIYTEIYHKKPSGTTVNLRLARAFIQFQDYEKAEKCFDRVESRCSSSSMYHHYKGLYFKKKDNLKEAAKHLKKAVNSSNIYAELDYTYVMMKVDKKFDAIEYLKSIIPKYEKSVALTQRIVLTIAYLQYRSGKDMNDALRKFLKAIRLNPNSKQLETFSYPLMSRWKKMNIFVFISQELLPKVTQRYPRIPPNIRDVYKNLIDLCEDYHRRRNESTAIRSLRAMKISM
ncbi:hypothetical protein QAD02_010756 [Eretmocerus hayati]|uniref:Uncharacterized protein n=1 Tax=Eretmocerus hayati TaxID=131215 RepID=A0ACC2NZK9_9HYME|nr:hypothetical protein QAD02_010756 [Eretmocerus hayati]